MDTFYIKITDEASLDLIQIYNYIANELKVPKIAAKQVDRIRKTIQSLDVLPLRNPIVSWEPWKSKFYRQVPIDNFIAYYATDEKQQIVTVLRIFYGKRNIETLIQDSSL